MVRDLHDGAQQRLVHTVVTLKLARRALENQRPTAPALVVEALEQAEAGDDRAARARARHPAGRPVRRRSAAAVAALAARVLLPVEFGLSVGRLPPAVEATAYFVVAEALTNVAKHAHAAARRR